MIKKAKKNKRFNFSYFKTLQNHDQILDYISSRLPILGEGTTRVVFAVSTHQVIKVAKNTNGYLQNSAELELYTNPYSNKVVTKINSIGQIDNNIVWLSCELLKPIQTIEEFEKASGLCWQTYIRLISIVASKIDKPHKEIIDQEYEKEVKRYEKIKEKGTHSDVQASYYELTCLKNIKCSTFFSSIVSAMKHSGLMPGDLMEYDHYGLNPEGRLILLDYGLTQEVARQMIIKRNSTLPPPCLTIYQNNELDNTEKIDEISKEYYNLISIKTRVIPKAQ